MPIKTILASSLLLAAAACATVAPQPELPAEAITLIINFEASDDGLTEFAGIMDGVSGAMQTEAGFVSAEVFRNQDNPNQFVLVEVWESRELHEEHFVRINESGDWAHINSLLKQAPAMGYYTPGS